MFFAIIQPTPRKEKGAHMNTGAKKRWAKKAAAGLALLGAAAASALWLGVMGSLLLMATAYMRKTTRIKLTLRTKTV